MSLKYAFQIQQNILEADRKLRSLDYNLVSNVEDQKPIEINTERSITEDDSMQTDMDFFQIEPPKPLENFQVIDTPVFEHAQFEKEPVIEGINESDIVIIKNEVEYIGESTSELQEDSIDTAVESSCKICGLMFPEKELMEHVKFHYFSNVKCDECNMPCENIHTYRLHLMEEHKDVPTNKNWVCKICQVSFLYKPLYIIHFRRFVIYKSFIYSKNYFFTC